MEPFAVARGIAVKPRVRRESASRGAHPDDHVAELAVSGEPCLTHRRLDEAVSAGRAECRRGAPMAHPGPGRYRRKSVWSGGGAGGELPASAGRGAEGPDSGAEGGEEAR
jgi:hypothetical protein